MIIFGISLFCVLAPGYPAVGLDGPGRFRSVPKTGAVLVFKIVKERLAGASNTFAARQSGG